MIKKLLTFSLGLLFLSSFSQQKSKPFSFKIDGSIRNFTGKKIYVHHKWEEKDYSDSANIVNGKFSFNLKSIDPNMYWFTTTNNINAQPNLIFFADASNVKASLIGDSIYNSKVEAGQTQKDYLEYRTVINNFVAQQQKLQTDYNAATQSNDYNALNAIRAEYGSLNTQFISGLKNFVKMHPKSAVSGFIIYNDMNNPNIPYEDVLEALSYVDKSIEETKFIKLANKRVESVKGTMVGYPATNFSQNTPDGKPLKLSDFKGKYVLVDFWASWCGPCRQENPNVVAAFSKYKDKGFTILGVSFDSNKDKWVEAIQKDNLTWSHVSDLKGWGNEVGKMYSITSIPQNILVGKDGKIIAKNLRGAALEEKLAEIIK
ncbi:MAG: AhpC/TSA family protein [Bacteroidetes bacterium]|nr:AhpC/TSA family protein [Bacteroidota bacterium]